MSKEIKFCTIDTPPANWGLSRKVIDREKYINFLNSAQNAFPDNAYFCNYLLTDHDSAEEHKPIQILGRIGSPSADGEVYRIKFRDMEFALKLMPRIDNDSESKNKREIETANLASQYPDYFPITFAYGYCPESSYYKNEIGETSPFIRKALEYSTYSTVIQHFKSDPKYKNQLKRFEASYRNLGPQILEESFSKLKIEKGKEKIQVDFLVSELANSDLGFWMTKNQSIEDWKQVLVDIFTGIYYLTIMLKKVHPDLHPGNLLIVKSKQKQEAEQEQGNKKHISALIHDFGRCYDIDEKVPEHWKATILSFCQEFISCSSRNDLIVPRQIAIMIDDIYNYFSNTDKNKEIILSPSNLKEIYETIILPIITN